MNQPPASADMLSGQQAKREERNIKKTKIIKKETKHIKAMSKDTDNMSAPAHSRQAGLPEKYSYLWTIFKGLPFGVGAIIIGIGLFLNTPSNVDKLQKVTGQVEWYGDKKIYTREIDASGNVFAIKIGPEFYYGEKKKVENKLKVEIPIAYKKKSEVIIWFVANKTIKQLSIDGRTVVPYKPYGTAIFFICFGVLITIGAVVYAIKYKSDVGINK